MDGWSARAVPGAEQSRLSLFLRTLFLCWPPHHPPNSTGALFVNFFFAIERLEEGGARQSSDELVSGTHANESHSVFNFGRIYRRQGTKLFMQ